MGQSNSKNQKALARIVRKPEVLITLGFSRSTLFNRIDAGLCPPSIPLGGRAVGWLESEIQTVLSALVSGMSPDDIKELVTKLVKDRTAKGSAFNG